jgi:hypothetical protein
MDLIFFCGQSNMQGQSECLSECETVAGAYEYKFLSDALVPLKNPVGEDITYDLRAGYAYSERVSAKEWRAKHALGSACYGHTNLVPAFCRAYTAHTKREVVAAHMAKGSTEITNWLPGTPNYSVLKSKAKAAIQKASPERIFLVWLQGESDAIAGRKKDEYKRLLMDFCNDLQINIGIERFGIIRVGYFTKDARDTEIIEAQDEICKENEMFLMLTTLATELNSHPEYMHPTIGGHFSARGLEILGAAAGEALAKDTV